MGVDLTKSRPKTAVGGRAGKKTTKKGTKLVPKLFGEEEYHPVVQECSDDEITKRRKHVDLDDEERRRGKEIAMLQKKSDAERKAKKQADDAATAEYVKKMQGLIKQKDYTYDYEGNVLVLNEGKEKDAIQLQQTNDLPIPSFFDTAPQVLKSSIPHEIPPPKPGERTRFRSHEMIQKRENYDSYKKKQLDQAAAEPPFIMDYKNPTLIEVLHVQSKISLHHLFSQKKV
jgi:hypothetical protein